MNCANTNLPEYHDGKSRGKTPASQKVTFKPAIFLNKLFSMIINFYTAI